TGDNAHMLIQLAGGATPEADLRAAYIARTTASGEEMLPLNLTDSGALSALQLQAGDRIVVPSLPVTRAQRAGVVSVHGEVNHGGDFPIISGVTKLSEIINGTGGRGAEGLTPYASLNGAYIERQVV